MRVREFLDLIGYGRMVECTDLEWCEVLYMFCDKDGYLRIELEYKEE